MMGNIPPRDVLANDSVEYVKRAVEQQLNSLADIKRIIFYAEWVCHQELLPKIYRLL